MRTTSINFILILLVWSTINLQGQHINGITSVATPQAFEGNPYERLSETKANWICLVPYGFSRLGQTELWFNVDRQWWGEKPEGVIKNIKLAKQHNLKIMLKPQVYVPGSWPGDLDFEKESDWETWEKSYAAFIDLYLDIAIEYEVELFCIGTEFKTSIKKRPDFWRTLIKDIRCRYTGELTYSANWDNYQNISFWEDLDKVGISCYMPMTDEPTPRYKTLRKGWKKMIKTLAAFSKKTGKKILFTEYGYLSVDGCAGKTWELEKKVRSLPINEQAQANAFNALYKNLWDKDFWAGGFIWKWFPEGMGHEGYVERDYTPQDKIAEGVIREWFGKDL